MRRVSTGPALGLLLALVASTAACGASGAPAPWTIEDAYLDDPRARRAELALSLVNPSNGYSQLRLLHYASGNGEDWDALPEWNPPFERVMPAELDAPGGAALRVTHGAALSMDIDPHDHAALLALGEASFFGYPVQLEAQAGVALMSREAATDYGFWLDDARGAGGIVRVLLPDGTSSFANTCATCHASMLGGTSLVTGVGNERLDLGALLVDAAGVLNPTVAAALLAWGPGRVDVTTADGTEPVRIPNLRPVRWLTHLHQDATLEQRDIVTLAIRLETLIITSQMEGVRPPRIVALALAEYVWSLADTLPTHAPSSAEQLRGQSLFSETCAGCHALPGYTGPPVPLDVVGTDPKEGESPDRGTGMYRVPSLHGVGTRPLLLHDASLPSLDAMFDPARTQPGFTGATRGPGAVPGHSYGLGLSDADRAALLAFLRTL